MDISFREFCIILFSNKYTEIINRFVVDWGQALSFIVAALLY
jgi:hypothetical protein